MVHGKEKKKWSHFDFIFERVARQNNSRILAKILEKMFPKNTYFYHHPLNGTFSRPTVWWWLSKDGVDQAVLQSDGRFFARSARAVRTVENLLCGRRAKINVKSSAVSWKTVSRTRKKYKIQGCLNTEVEPRRSQRAEIRWVFDFCWLRWYQRRRRRP